MATSRNNIDSAKGPLAGYLFQFEKALVLLASLEGSTDYISIEEVDDTAAHSENGTVLLTMQAKHSIASSGTTFQDTSTSLWKTINIWIRKLENGTFNEATTFVCSTNKAIPHDSLIKGFITNSLEDSISACKSLLLEQRQKLEEITRLEPDKGTSVKQTIKYIETALLKEDLFKIILNKIEILESEVPKIAFLNKIHLGSEALTDNQLDFVYQIFYGWITHSSLAKWKNENEARFSKSEFNKKWITILTHSSIKCAVFRTKESIGSICDDEILKKKQELFVRQIDDIQLRRDAKERIIKKAITEFIYSEVELKYLIEKGNYTAFDFEEFLDSCFDFWQQQFDEIVTKELSEYDEDMKNEMGLRLYNKIMNMNNLEFGEGIPFSSKNVYIRNGSFLKLSNVPRIGWLPDWDEKYIK